MGVAVVTGSDSGIGKATAVALAEAGFDVGITWHTDEAGAKGTAEEVSARGRRAEVRRLDLSDLPAAAGVIDELAEALGGLDVFVNNAGTDSNEPFLEMDLDSWRHVLDVDLTGPMLCAQRAARRMVAGGGGGRIVNVTSVHEHVPLERASAYCAAKGGLGLLTKVMALELAEHGILVNSVVPGEISTPMTRPEGGSSKHSSGPLHRGPATGHHDVDPHTEDAPASPLADPATLGRSRPPSSTWRARRRRTRRARRSSSTADCCSWPPRPTVSKALPEGTPSSPTNKGRVAWSTTLMTSRDASRKQPAT